MSDIRSDAICKYQAAVRRTGIPNPLRHFRGRGIHSPFAYSLVRNVFMKTKLQGNEITLYETLRSHGAEHRTAVELQNLFTHCGYDDFRICCGKSDGSDDFLKNVNNSAKLLVITSCVNREELLYLVNVATSTGIYDVCLMVSDSRRGRLTFCRDIALRHEGMSIENRRMIVLFNRRGLNEEHIRL